jgi:hypothetical protein
MKLWIKYELTRRAIIGIRATYLIGAIFKWMHDEGLWKRLLDENDPLKAEDIKSLVAEHWFVHA